MGRIQVYDEVPNSWQALVRTAESDLGLVLEDDLRHYLTLLLLEHQASSWDEVAWDRCWMGDFQAEPLDAVQLKAERALLSVGLYPGRIIKMAGGLDLAMGCSHALYCHLGQGGDALFLSIANNMVAMIDVLMMVQESAQKRCVLEPLDAKRFWQNYPDALYPGHVLSRPQ